MAGRAYTLTIWTALTLAALVPMIAAAYSPLLAWRDATYIVAGFAGIAGLVVLLVQPLLAGGFLPGLSRYNALRVHAVTGALLVFFVIVHVAGLWITSPPDVVDALLFVSPTPFSVWGVIAMWAIFASAGIALRRKKLRWRARHWRLVHLTLGLVIAGGTVVHALQIEGTMETLSKAVLCALVALACLVLLYKLQARGVLRPRA